MLNKAFKNKKGITLIALIITIIVLLILAGVTIAAITSNESAPNKAVEARKANDIGAAKDAATLLVAEKVQSYYEAKYVNRITNEATVGGYVNAELATAVTRGEHTIQVVGGKLQVTKGSDTTPLATGTITPEGTITWDATPAGGNGGGQQQGGEENQQQGQGGDVPPVIQTISSKKTAVGATVQAVNATANTTLEDDLGNEVIIPAGFGIAEDSGTKVEEGIVIEDATNGNQFVWVPVGTDIKVSTTINPTGKIDILLSRYTFNEEDGTPTARDADYEIPLIYNEDIDDKFYFTETVSNTVARKTMNDTEIEFVKQANDKGGYYIARYEAGVSGTTASSTGKNYTINEETFIKNSNADGYIVSKTGVGVWNNISRDNALLVSQRMYSNDLSKFRSELVTSYAWDTAIVFIEKCGTNNNYANLYGNSSGTRIYTTGTTILSETNNMDIQCNIYDLAGNVSEWTTESSDDIDVPAVVRGGYYLSDEDLNYTCSREIDDTTSVNKAIGFRPILYIM